MGAEGPNFGASVEEIMRIRYLRSEPSHRWAKIMALSRYICVSLMFTPSLGLAFTDYNNDGRMDLSFHRPGSSWGSAPILMSVGDGRWTSYNSSVPSWVNQQGVIAIPGDYDSDGRDDVAFHRPGGPWNTVPVLFSRGDGSWSSTNLKAPSWANQPGVRAVPGDYDRDGDTDIAFYRPGGSWSTIPILFSLGDGRWSSTNASAPSWANQSGVIAIPGDYNNDGRTDIAFHKPGGSWLRVPVLLSQGNGTWLAVNSNAPSWANQSGVVAIPGDFDRDGRSDIAFHKPGGGWNSVPVLFANGGGSWSSTNLGVPSWANQPDVVAIPGDFDGDDRSDIAFHRPRGPWNSVPVLYSNGRSNWSSRNTPSPQWAHEPNVQAVSGDVNRDGRADIAFYRPGSSWNSVPVLFSNGRSSWSSSDRTAPNYVHALGARAMAAQSGKTNQPDTQPSDLRYQAGSPLWQADPNLVAPEIIQAEGTDNAIILTWRDNNNSSHDGYLIAVPTTVILSRDIAQTHTSVLRVPATARSAWFVELPTRQATMPLVPGGSYRVDVAAFGPNGVSRFVRREIQLTKPTTRLSVDGGQSFIEIDPDQAFAPLDLNSNGVLDSAAGSGGVFPLWQDVFLATPVTREGNLYDRVNNSLVANVVAGYFYLDTNIGDYFSACHLRIDPQTNQTTGLSMTHGPIPAGSNRQLWTGVVAEVQTFVQDGDAVLGTPNIVQGRCTGLGVAPDLSLRPIEMIFNLALTPD